MGGVGELYPSFFLIFGILLTLQSPSNIMMNHPWPSLFDGGLYLCFNVLLGKDVE